MSFELKYCDQPDFINSFPANSFGIPPNYAKHLNYPAADSLKSQNNSECYEAGQVTFTLPDNRNTGWLGGV